MMISQLARVGRRGHSLVSNPHSHGPVLPSQLPLPWFTTSRSARYQAFEADLDPEDLAEARTWRQSFKESRLPRGITTFARSSGPGGQHVNKTESKAITTWSAGELIGMLPKLLRSQIRNSKYYSKGNDALAFQAQTQRSRTANAEENRQKLFEELVRMYAVTVPGETSSDKIDKHKKIEKAFHNRRIQDKKQHSAKKQSRRKGSIE